MSLKQALNDVAEFRERNADVFVMPEPPWTAVYITEELAETMRWVQKLLAPEHLRGNPKDDFDLLKAMIEYGDLLLMVLTLGLQMDLDPDVSLRLSLAKLSARCEETRHGRAADGS